MKASETRVDRFLATSETTFAIPVYQRNYDWSVVQCKQLLHDIIETGGNDEMNAHFIGSIVYVHDDVYSASGLNELTIIDGQQRLTTLTLIYVTIYRLAKRLKNDMLVNKIQKMYLINEFAPETEKLKLKPIENNRTAFHFILNSDEKDEFLDGYSRIIENFNYFRNQINEANYETVLKGLSKLVFVDIALDRTKDNPQRIFESLNSTGLDLSQADLIRNYILMGLNRKEQDKIYRNYWEVIERNAKDEISNESHVSEFIRDYLTLINKEIPNKKDVYTKFRSKFPTTTPEALEDVLSSVKSLVRFYNKLLNPKNETDIDIRKQLEYIKQLEINVAYPFLMKVYEDYANNKIDKITFIKVLNLVQSFTWRRFIVGLPTNALNKIFMTLYDKMDDDNYLLSIQRTLLQKSGSQRFPKNNEIINALKEKDVYNTQSKNITYFLECIENYENIETVKIDGNTDITIEHIFPQNPDPKWKIELGDEEYGFIKDNYLNTIGNLTLSGNNGKLGNKPFSEKRDMNIDNKEQGYKYSRLWLNRELKDKSVWNRLEIENRTKLIADRFLKIWEYPEISISEEENDEINIFEVDDPTGKKMEYYIFFDQRVSVPTVTHLYVYIFRQLFDLRPELFFNTNITNRIVLTTNPSEYGNRQFDKLNDTYYLCVNFSNQEKFERIKEALMIFGFKDELIIKFAAKNDNHVSNPLPELFI
jgi:uncharacterized protein with ParB-like and HNH nuclease domain